MGRNQSWTLSKPLLILGLLLACFLFFKSAKNPWTRAAVALRGMENKKGPCRYANLGICVRAVEFEPRKDVLVGQAGG